jgi:hypothetical protein
MKNFDRSRTCLAAWLERECMTDNSSGGVPGPDRDGRGRCHVRS